MAKIFSVGVFDSGIGGLTVLAPCVRALPGVRFCYLGDNSRAPYGSRPPREIARFVKEGLRCFRRLGVDAAVLACNTATAVCLEEMRAAFPFPIVGTEPAVRSAAPYGDVLVLCTPRTAASGRLAALLSAFPEARFTVHPTELAGEIERRLPRGERVDLAPFLPEGKFGAVVLGCTHYAFLKEEIAARFRAPVFDGAEGVARRLAALLSETEVEREGSGGREINERLPPKWRGNGHTNECSQAKWSRAPEKEVLFLGKSARLNEKLYKQTFFSPLSGSVRTKMD